MFCPGVTNCLEIDQIVAPEMLSYWGQPLQAGAGDGAEPVGCDTGAGEGGPSGEGAGSAGGGSVASCDTGATFGEEARD